MRVTGGRARGRRLRSPQAGARPTSDRVREAIFNVLESQGADLSRVLDLYAGSGALGIEALSRGAGRCDFVERAAANAAIIRENLHATGLEEQAKVYRSTVERVADQLSGPYALIFADPPYEDDAALAALDGVARSSLVGANTTLVLEHSSRRDGPERLGRLARAWSRRYGDTQVSMYAQEQEGDAT